MTAVGNFDTFWKLIVIACNSGSDRGHRLTVSIGLLSHIGGAMI